MAPAMSTTEPERPSTTLNGPVSGSRRLFIKLSIAVVSLLVVGLVFAGTVYKDYLFATPTSNTQPGLAHKENVPVGTTSMLTLPVLSVSPLQAPLLWFKRHTIPAVSVAVAFMILVILATILLVVQSQSTDDATSADVVNPTPSGPDKPSNSNVEAGVDYGFFSVSTIASIVVVLIIIGLFIITYGIHRHKGKVDSSTTYIKEHNEPTIPVETSLKRAPIIREITENYRNIYKVYDQLNFNGKCFFIEDDLYKDGEELKDLFNHYKFKVTEIPPLDRSSWPYTLKDYNRIFMQHGFVAKDPKVSMCGPFVLRATNQDGDNLKADKVLPTTFDLIAVTVNEKYLPMCGEYEIEGLLKFVKSLTTDDDDLSE